MELSLPKKLTKEKRYRHFTIEAYPTKESASAKRIDFFYIGANFSKIDLLVKTFEGGYVLENVENAIPFLKRHAEKHTAPDVIIVDRKIDEASIRRLHDFLSTTPKYASVPLMIDGSGLSATELAHCRAMKFIDEIIFLENTGKEQLVTKANFLKRIKAQTNKYSFESNIRPLDKKYTFTTSGLLKRTFDILVSSAAILLLSPLLLLIAVLVRLESKGPILYIAPRAGRGYKIFNFYKFRTMVVDADKQVKQLAHLNQYDNNAETGPAFFKISNDPRITKIGAFLRNTSLDELPQLFNVLLGDMSLVGNRPLPLYEAATLTTDQHAARFMASAGITGLWQIKKRGNNNMSVEERITLDIIYARKANFFYDFWIMTQTPTALIQKTNV